MKQLELALIPHEVEGNVINQRASDGYINATAMCKSVSKQFNDYSRLKSTKEFLIELSADTGIPVSELNQSLINHLLCVRFTVRQRFFQRPKSSIKDRVTSKLRNFTYFKQRHSPSFNA